MIRGVILDLDGTLYRGDREVPGAAAFVNYLKQCGIPYLLVTNRANRKPDAIRDHLRGYGIPCEEQDILTSAQATAQHLRKGRAFCIGEEGLFHALTTAGITITEDSPDYVIVSMDRSLTYEKLKKASILIRRGAKFIATNPDVGLPDGDEVLPGTGAIVAAVQTTTGVQPLFIGKPERLIFDMAVKQMGLTPDTAIAVGDNIHTDIVGGQNAGLRTVLILTGMSTREDMEKAAIKPTWTVNNYAELTKIIQTHAKA